LPANAAEKVSGVNKDYQVLSTVSSAIPDKPGHTFRQIVQTWKATGSSDLANFLGTAVLQQEAIGGDTKTRGYGTGRTANGDLSYFSLEGTSKVTPKEGAAFEVNGSGTFKWLGGTGKYQKLSGDGTYSCGAIRRVPNAIGKVKRSTERACQALGEPAVDWDEKLASKVVQ
jgi:hypothetical protein